MYFQGRGSMLIKLLSAVKVVDATGHEMDQGSLVRYLAEMPWFPTSLLPSGGLVKWEPVDGDSARAIMKDGDLTIET